MIPTEQCPRCYGTGDCYHYPRGGGIHAYPCPKCRGTGETPRKGYVIQGPYSTHYETDRRRAKRFARDLCFLGCTPGQQVTVMAIGQHHPLARYQRTADGRTITLTP